MRCVLLSPEEYVGLMDEVNDARLLREALSRLENYDPAATLSVEEINSRLGISPEDLASGGDAQIR